MVKVKRKDYVFLSKWEGQDLVCACMFFNPKCNSKECEEIELSLLPYENLEQCMKERKYQRVNGALRQK